MFSDAKSSEHLQHPLRCPETPGGTPKLCATTPTGVRILFDVHLGTFLRLRRCETEVHG